MKIKFSALLLFSLLFLQTNILYAVDAPKLKNPIVLVHGATMKGNSLWLGPIPLGEYFQKIPEYLTNQLGASVFVPEFPPDISIEERAMILKNYLDANFRGGQKVNIIAHSLGGLAARYMISVLGSDHVKSLTTIGTPHHGTPLAIWSIRQAKEKTFWYYLLRLFGEDLSVHKFLPELVPDYLEKTFNPKVANDPRVKYFSVAGFGVPQERSMALALIPLFYFIREERHAMSQDNNDGLVPVTSQMWGESLGTLELDHLAQINHFTLCFSSDSEKTYGMYKLIYDRLAKDGF